MKDSWIVLGSSPSAKERYGDVEGCFDYVITCNRGIYLERHPTFYYLSDPVAYHLFRTEAMVAKESGTTLVGLTSPAAQHGWTEFDILVPDELNHGLSGINCLDFAARSGAGIIYLIGMHGYEPWKPLEENHFEAPLEENMLIAERELGIESLQQWWLNRWFAGGNSMAKRVVDKTQRVVDAHPDVEFICVGRPHYKVYAPNWRVME